MIEVLDAMFHKKLWKDLSSKCKSSKW